MVSKCTHGKHTRSWVKRMQSSQKWVVVKTVVLYSMGSEYGGIIKYIFPDRTIFPCIDCTVGSYYLLIRTELRQGVIRITYNSIKTNFLQFKHKNYFSFIVILIRYYHTSIRRIQLLPKKVKVYVVILNYILT